MKLNFLISKLTILLILACLLYVTVSKKQYKQGVIKYDIVSYYAYLPAFFIYKDLTFSFIDKKLPKEIDICTEKTPENKRVVKMPCGLAIVYAPFFLIAHAIAHLQPDKYTPNGYSMVYSLLLILSDIFYTIIGLIYLRKILLRSFSETVTSLTLLGLFFGTNLYYYSMFEVMAHNYLFCFITMFLYYSIQWHKNPSRQLSIYVGLLLGIITLIRPVDILVCLLWLFYGVYSINTFKQRIYELWQSKNLVLLIGFLSFGVFFIQMFYWKFATDHWFYWSYTNEHFFFTHPHILEGLFGFRKGLYVYTPLLFFASIGMLLTYKYLKALFLPCILLFIVFSYVILSWWCWWYGGGVSIRPMVDIYCMFGVGLATFLHVLSQLKSIIIKLLTISFLISLTYYGYFINWQSCEGLIHYDSMTYKSWKIHFMKETYQADYNENLSTPDYDLARETGHE